MAINVLPVRMERENGSVIKLRDEERKGEIDRLLCSKGLLLKVLEGIFF